MPGFATVYGHGRGIKKKKSALRKICVAGRADKPYASGGLPRFKLQEANNREAYIVEYRCFKLSFIF